MVNIHARKITDDLASLVKKVDAMVGSAADRKSSKKAFLVYLTDDPDAAAEELEKFAKKHKIKNMPLTVFDGETGPRRYKIAEDAEVTVMLWEGLKVEYNHAFGAKKLNKKGVMAVMKDVKKHLADDEDEDK